MPRPVFRHRYPVEPLLHAAHATSYAHLDRLVGVGVGVTDKTIRRGGLSWQAADRWAVALELHPSEIWGFEWTEDAA